jgi:hypothetical protein
VERGKNGVFKATVTEPDADLFANGEAMMLASHPNQPYSPETGFNRLKWVGGTANPPKNLDFKGALALRPAMSCPCTF